MSASFPNLHQDRAGRLDRLIGLSNNLWNMVRPPAYRSPHPFLQWMPRLVRGKSPAFPDAASQASAIPGRRPLFDTRGRPSQAAGTAFARRGRRPRSRTAACTAAPVRQRAAPEFTGEPPRIRGGTLPKELRVGHRRVNLHRSETVSGKPGAPRRRGAAHRPTGAGVRRRTAGFPTAYGRFAKVPNLERVLG